MSCAKRTKKVGIQPFEGIDQTDIHDIAEHLNKKYNLDVTILPIRNIPTTAFVNIKSPRYRADVLLEELKRFKPDSLDYVLGLTHFDISTTKYGGKDPKYKDWGVFGLGYQPGPSCIVSTFRLKNRSKSLFEERLKKICVHELGHNMGLSHCKSVGCIMQDAAETIKKIDQSDGELCAKCKSKLN